MIAIYPILESNSRLSNVSESPLSGGIGRIYPGRGAFWDHQGAKKVLRVDT